MRVQVGDKIFDCVDRAIEFLESLCKMYKIDCPEIEGESQSETLYRFAELLGTPKDKIVFLENGMLDST